MDGRFTRQKNEIPVWMVVKGRKCGGALRASPFHPDSSTWSRAQMKCVDEGFVKRPWKLQILFLRRQPMYVRLQKSLERRPNQWPLSQNHGEAWNEIGWVPILSLLPHSDQTVKANNTTG